jgi:DNA-binding MarR family transcriptional regulator
MCEADLWAEARALRRTLAGLQRSFRTTRDPDGPTPAQLSALGTLLREGPMATGELARRERLRPQSVTRLVAALAARGFIERLADDADRRRLVIAVTADGRRELAREMQRRDARLAGQLARFTPAERATLGAARALIERLNEPN